MTQANMASERERTSRSKALLILGMHRSGTSALARVLNLLGADIASNLMEPGNGNEEGFWESKDVYWVHEELFCELGLHWHSLRELPEGWLDSAPARSAARKLEQILARDFSKTNLWVAKDPRLCRLFPLWERVLRSASIDVLPVLAVRQPGRSVRSLQKMVGKHHQLPGEHYLSALWARYLKESEESTRTYPRLLVTFDDLIENWRDVARRIEDKFGFQWPNRVEDAAHQIDEFLDAGLVHQRSDVDEVNERYSRIYRASLSCRDDAPSWDELSDELERFAAEMAPATRMLTELEESRDTLIKEKAESEAGLGRQAAELSEEVFALRKLSLQSEDHVRDLLRLLDDSMRDLADSRMNATNSDEEHRLEVQRLISEMESIRAAHAEASRDLYESKKKVIMLEDEVRTLREHLASALQERRSVQEREETTRKMVRECVEIWLNICESAEIMERGQEPAFHLVEQKKKSLSDWVRQILGNSAIDEKDIKKRG